MDGRSEPVSAARLAGLAIAAALGAIVATVGLLLSDPGDDAERISYLVSLIAAGATAMLLPMLLQRRRVEIARLRADASVLVFKLRMQAAELAQPERMPSESLAEALREAMRLAVEARALVKTLIRSGVEREAIELRVAIEAIERSLSPGRSAPRSGRRR